jgi:hypothetical protein
MKHPSVQRLSTALSAEHFHAVDATTCKQTLDESEIEY